MKDCREFYIDGKWVRPTEPRDFPVVNPATEARIATISLGSRADVDKAVAAAKKAFASYGETTVEQRLALLQRIIEVYQSKYEEIAPLSGYLFTQIMHEAGVPPGVFNMVNGDGPTVGAAISSHPDVDMVSFTGSTRAGVAVATAAAPTVKRVTQELGGKSANIILDDADVEQAVMAGVQSCVLNTGQSCNAPTRMLIPRSKMAEAIAAAKRAADAVTVGDPSADGITIGPLASEAQVEKVQRLIKKGMEDGAELVTGGPGRPDGISKGYFVRPTVFANVRNDMTIAREEIFGPVLSIIPYQDENDAVRIANDTPYGLSGYVTSGNIERARRVARRIRAGNVNVNGAQPDFRRDTDS